MDDQRQPMEATLGRKLMVGATVGSLIMLIGGLMFAPSFVTNYLWAAPLLAVAGAMAGLLVVSIIVRSSPWLEARRHPPGSSQYR